MKKQETYWVEVLEGITSRRIEQHGPFPLEVAYVFAQQRAMCLHDRRSVRIEQNRHGE